MTVVFFFDNISILRKVGYLNLRQLNFSCRKSFHRRRYESNSFIDHSSNAFGSFESLK
jgi:hypothetical protein